MAPVVLLSLVACFYLAGRSEGIQIQLHVAEQSTPLVDYTDVYANIQDYEITGYLVYPALKADSAGCTDFRPLNDSYSDYYIALIDNYDNCSLQTSQLSLQHALVEAGYIGMIGISSEDKELRAIDYLYFAIALVKQKEFGNELKRYAGVNSTTVTLVGDSIYQRYFLIFSVLLLSAIVLSVIVFCCTMCCRLGVFRWANRRIKLWSVRQLPKRRYCPERDTCDTCSICLESFKENENLRVLPCQHVYHPRCIDEWLHRWNCVCPLCKASIRNHRRTSTGAETTERASLLINEHGGLEGGRGYGAATAPSATAAAVPPPADGDARTSPQTEGSGAVASPRDGSVQPSDDQATVGQPPQAAVKA